MKHQVRALLQSYPLNRLGLAKPILRWSERLRAWLPHDRDAVEQERIDGELEVREVMPLDMFPSALESPRLSLLIPSVNRLHAFGGIATALQLFERIERCYGATWQYRIVAVDAPLDDDLVVDTSRYQPYFMDTESDLTHQLIAVDDRAGRRLDVRRSDYFLATAWWTAHHGLRLMQTQNNLWAPQERFLTYLIQDFEPGFYNWSARYALAEATYQSELPVKAIFNTALLRDYMQQQGFCFAKSFAFEPVMNSAIRGALRERYRKQRRILIYARPGTARNLFELVVMALRIWVQRDPNAASWELIGLGESFPDVELGAGKVLRSLGKVALDEYGRHMQESAVGISLMLSPHPSYPPLEMSQFGMRVITNSYRNKRLEGFSPRIRSLSSLYPEAIAAAVTEACARYQEWVAVPSQELNAGFLREEPDFGFLAEIYRALS